MNIHIKLKGHKGEIEYEGEVHANPTKDQYSNKSPYYGEVFEKLIQMYKSLED